jgi:uncharacterized membrane protein
MSDGPSTGRMGKGRLEAFSDGVIAIIITIMVLELKVPAGASFNDALSILPSIGTYAFSFLYVGIYWNNHHHMLHAARHVTGGVLWANQHLLFWLSLLPFSTRWMAESDFATWPVAVYGLSLLTPSIAYYILEQTLIAVDGADSMLGRAVGRDVNGLVSTSLYIAGIVLTFWHAWAGMACYVAVSLIWLVPDRRIERL